MNHPVFFSISHWIYLVVVLVLSFSAVVVCLLAAIESVLCPTFDLVGARLGRPVVAPGMGLVASLPAANVK